MKKFFKYVIDEQPIFIVLLILGLLTTNICMYFSCYKVPMHYKVDTFYGGEPGAAIENRADSNTDEKNCPWFKFIQ